MPVKPDSSAKAKNPFITGYIVVYNAVLVAGWALMGVQAVLHLSRTKSIQGLYNAVEMSLLVFQTCAVMEVVHCAVGLVRSSVFLTGFQVASRVFVVWGIVYSVPESRNNIGFPLLLFAWSITEVIRYSFYALNELNLLPFIVKWLRYTLFIVLYPLGVTGELLCIWSSLPTVKAKKLYSLELPNQLNFSFSFYYYLFVVMLAYIPIFPQLYFHMFGQRKKTLAAVAEGATKKQR